MHIAVHYSDERFEFELPADRVVASWGGPAGLEASKGVQSLRDALEAPLDYPPPRQIAVPGDRLVIAFDPTIAPVKGILTAIMQQVGQAGVEPGDVTVVLPQNGALCDTDLLPGASLVVHDPSDRSHIAYLATTKQGRRVYLNRFLTDADVVIPVARLGYDPFVGYRGPWSLLYPTLSDRETLSVYRSQSLRETPDDTGRVSLSKLDESFEVSWLLGSQFHIGIVPGYSGIVETIAGREVAVRQYGLESLERHWQFRAAARAELVVVGIGRPGLPATLENLAAGLHTAMRLVRHGGKIIALSRVSGPIGPAVRALCDLDDPREATAMLRRHESDDDYRVARYLAQALAWADVFLLSSLPEDVVEEMSMVALESAEQAQRLVAKSGSCSFLSGAELTRAVIVGENDG